MIKTALLLQLIGYYLIEFSSEGDEVTDGMAESAILAAQEELVYALAIHVILLPFAGGFQLPNHTTRDASCIDPEPWFGTKYSSQPHQP